MYYVYLWSIQPPTTYSTTLHNLSLTCTQSFQSSKQKSWFLVKEKQKTKPLNVIEEKKINENMWLSSLLTFLCSNQKKKLKFLHSTSDSHKYNIRKIFRPYLKVRKNTAWLEMTKTFNWSTYKLNTQWVHHHQLKIFLHVKKKQELVT